MGEIAEAMLDGTLCQSCGEYIGTGAGHPRSCGSCGSGSGGASDGRHSRWDKRQQNREQSTDILIKRGVTFEAKNFGRHLIITRDGRTVDFWPGTGLWIFREGKKGRGVFNLLKEIER